MAKLTWERCLLVFGCSFSLFCSNIFAYLDLEELKSVHYDIDILSTPVLRGRPVKQEVLHLRSKYGQQYECQLPDMTDYEKDQEEEKLATDMGISELLKPMENAPCLIKTKDWWSYEFCHGRHVKQYHLEDGKLKGDVVFMGYYESEMDWNNKTHKDAKRHRLNRYHSHTYVNGSTCDLTKKPRETEVRFVCSEGQGDSIFRIDEPSSCVYVLTIHTSRTCHHPYLRPPPSLKARPVLCYPALEQDQYDKYLEIKQETPKNKERHFIAFGATETIPQSPPLAESEPEAESEPAKEPSASQETRTVKTPFEPSLLEDLDETSLDVDGLEEALAMGADPSLLNDLVKNILKSVQDNVKTIDREVTDKPKTGKDSAEKATESEEDDYDDDDDDDDDIFDLGELDADAEFEDGELETLMEKDIGSLLAEYRDQISKMTTHPAEIERMHMMVDNIEATLDEIDAVNSLIEEEAAMSGLGDEGDDESDGDRLLTSTLRNLMKDVQNKVDQPNMASKDIKKSSSSSSSSSKGGIKLKVTKVSIDKDSQTKRDTLKETEVYDSNHRPIEDAIMQQMEKAGVDMDGIGNEGKIEFRIMAYTPNEWPEDEEDDGVTVLSEEESIYFKNVVMGLLGRGAESTEQRRHERLETNYQFVWEPPQGTENLGTESLGTESLGTESLGTKNLGTENLGTGETDATDIEADGEVNIP